MTSSSKTINVFVGECNGKDYVFALTEESAKALVESHFAFGNATESEYAVGNVWAETKSDVGWRIRRDEVEAYPITVELLIADGEGNLSWICPFCETAYSDDWSKQDSMPILLRCGCTGKSRYLIGDVSK